MTNKETKRKNTRKKKKTVTKKTEDPTTDVPETDIVVDQSLSQRPEESIPEVTEMDTSIPSTAELPPSEVAIEPSEPSSSPQPLEPAEVEIDITPIPTVEDVPRSRFGQYVKSKLSQRAPLELRKQLLPNESLLSSKMVIYYSEGQIFLGLFSVLLAFLFVILFSDLLIFWVFAIIGVMLILTGYASEELHITDFRIMVRRMTWVDRFFHIPRDSQYILDEIVSFDIERAPMNMALVYSAILPWLLFLVPNLRNSFVLIIVIITSLVLLILSQRLDKRAISFNMSGGHQVQLGIFKGIPNDVVEAFIDIVMEKNIFESDDY